MLSSLMLRILRLRFAATLRTVTQAVAHDTATCFVYVVTRNKLHFHVFNIGYH